MSETVQLEYPFDFKGERVTELTLRRPKMRDLKKSQAFKDDLDKSLRMIADLAEVDPKLVEELDPQDFGRLADIVGEFMGDAVGQTQQG